MSAREQWELEVDGTVGGTETNSYNLEENKTQGGCPLAPPRLRPARQRRATGDSWRPRAFCMGVSLPCVSQHVTAFLKFLRPAADLSQSGSASCCCIKHSSEGTQTPVDVTQQLHPAIRGAAVLSRMYYTPMEFEKDR